MPDAMLNFFGRLHPMVLHLPIGLLIGLGAWELWRALRRRTSPELGASAVFLGWVAALSSAGAIATGLAHEFELGADPTTNLHKWLGIAAGGGSLITAILASCLGGTSSGARAKRGLTRCYRFALFATLAVLLPAGHLGADITHGEGYLIAPLVESMSRASGSAEAQGGSGGVAAGSDPASGESPGGPSDHALVAARAREVIAARCESCHGAGRVRGGLRLHTLDAILAGGRDGPVIVPGDPSASLLIQRVRLPLDDADHMPPRNRPQPTEEEIAAIEAWIRTWDSAIQDATSGGQGATDAAGGGPSPAATLEPARPLAPEALAEPAAPDPSALAALRARLVHVQPVAAGSHLLWVDLSSLPDLDDDSAAELLSPLRDNVADLSLARTSIGDAALALVSSMPRLRRLDLAQTASGDAGLARLMGHPSLETLILSGTNVTDGCAPMLASLPALRRVFLWQTQISDGALDWLAVARPDLQVDTGRSGDSPLETEPQVVVGAPDAPPPPGSPINTVCPVTGSPADPRFTLVHAGRTVAFCCENCPKQFAADPDRFVGNLPDR